jgi:hypothetical protein
MKLPDAYLARKLNDDEKPPWTGDERRMVEWVIQELDLSLFDFEYAQRHTPEAVERAEQFFDSAKDEDEVATAIYCAEHGDIEPLRRLYPHYAEFLNLPKRANHSQWPKLPSRRFKLSDPKVALLFAADDVRRIRAIWRHHYHRKNRRDPPFAEDIAAERWNIEDHPDLRARDKIINFMKK